jgi:hypothetical protein
MRHIATHQAQQRAARLATAFARYFTARSTSSTRICASRDLRRLRTSDLSAITQIGDDRRDRLELLSLVGFEGFEAKTLLAPAQLELLYDVWLGLEAWYSALANLGEMLAHVSVGRQVSSFVLPEQLRGSRLERTLRNRIDVFVFNPYLYMPA